MPLRLIPWLLSVAWVGGLLASDGQQVPVARKPVYAVLEFEPAGGASNLVSCAQGMGDLMELAMQGRGADLVTRRFIMLVLGERGLARRGMSAAETVLGQGNLLPVDRLVKGVVSRKGSEAFEVEIRVLDPKTGVEVASVVGGGRYPEGVMSVLEELAAKMLGTPAGNDMPPAPVLPGITTTPEVMSTFTQGLRFMMEGYPIHAISRFRAALKADPAFFIVRLWKARCYEALGLDDHAQIEWRLHDGERNKSGTPAKEEVKGEAGMARRPILTVLFVNDAWTFTAVDQTRLKDGLRRQPGIQLFSPDWMRQLTDEQDLRLSGEWGALGVLDSRVWMQSEYLLVLKATQDGHARQIHASVLELDRGRLLAAWTIAEQEAIDFGPKVAATVGKAAEPGPMPPLSRAALMDLNPTNCPRLEDLGEHSWVEVEPLKNYALDPGNRKCLTAFFYGSDALRFQTAIFRGGDEVRSHGAWVAEKLLRSITAGEPDAALWEASALWMRAHANEPPWWDFRHGLENGLSAQNLERVFAGYLAEHPDSRSSTCVRYALAALYLRVREYAKAKVFLDEATRGIVREYGVSGLVVSSGDLRALASAPNEKLAPDDRRLLASLAYTQAYLCTVLKNRSEALGFHEALKALGTANIELRRGIEPRWAGLKNDSQVANGGSHWFVFSPHIRIWWMNDLNNLPLNSVEELTSMLQEASDGVPLNVLFNDICRASGEERWALIKTYCRRSEQEPRQPASQSPSAWHIDKNDPDRTLATVLYLGHDCDGANKNPVRVGELRDMGRKLAETRSDRSRRALLLMTSANFEEYERLVRQEMGATPPGFELYVVATRVGLVKGGWKGLADACDQVSAAWDAAGWGKRPDFRILLYKAQALRYAGELDRAAGLFERFLATPEPQGIAGTELAGLRLTCRYQLASVEADRGNAVKGMEMLKDLVDDPATGSGQVFIIGDIMNPQKPYPSQVAQYPTRCRIFLLNLREQAQRALEAVREGKKIIHDEDLL